MQRDYLRKNSSLIKAKKENYFHVRPIPLPKGLEQIERKMISGLFYKEDNRMKKYRALGNYGDLRKISSEIMSFKLLNAKDMPFQHLN